MLNRRQFLRWTGAGVAMSVWLNACGDDDSGDGDAADRVIVIGAGAAGLTVANALTTAGRETVVLEGRDRIGGRIWSADVDGVPVDLGGMWLHGTRGNPAACILNHEGIGWQSAEFIGFDTRVFDSARNRDLSTQERIALLTLNSEFYDAIPSLLRTLGPDASMAAATTAFLDQSSLDEPARRNAEFAILTDIELGAAQSARQISLASFADDDDGGEDDEPYTGDHFPDGSYRGLVDSLARGVDVRLNTVVSRIEYSGSRLVVETSNGTETGSHVVVTVPLGVLKAGSIEFAPALPDAKLAAIARIGMGELEKVVLRYEDPFWQTPGTGNILYNGATPGEFPLIVDYTPYAGGRPTVVAFYCGDYGRDIASLSDQDIAGRAAAIVNEIGGTRARTPTDVRVTRWKSDPFALGSYPSNPVLASESVVASLAADYEAMAAPVGERLLFAGDATTYEFGSTVEGAVVSGIREAERLLGRQGQGVVLDSGLLIAPGCNEEA